MNRLSTPPLSFKHVAIGVICGLLLGVAGTSYFNWRMAAPAPEVAIIPAPEPTLVAPTPKPKEAAPPQPAPIELATPPVLPASSVPAVVPPVSTPEAPVVPTAATSSAVQDLRDRRLDVPVKGTARADLRESFNDRRDGTRTHEALDVLAPRNTPVLAVEDGKIAKLFDSKAGGITIYQFDPSSRYVYYYAHLERYADGLAEGNKVQRGQVLGYVGTSGNAPKDTPHLHFAIFQLTDKKEWWKGTPLDPYLILK